MTSKNEQRFEGAFLDALDLPEGKLIPIVIDGIVTENTEEDASGRLIDKPIVSFRNTKTGKRLILGKTNKDVIRALYGSDRTQWIGKTVSLQRRYIKLNDGFARHIGYPAGQPCMTIRVVPPAGTLLMLKTIRQMGSVTPDGSAPKTPPPKTPTPLEIFVAEIEAAKDSKKKLAELSLKCDQFGEDGKKLEQCIETYYQTAKDDLGYTKGQKE